MSAPRGATGCPYRTVVGRLLEGPVEGGVISVVSPHRGDGRSTAAAGLAAALARATGSPSLLVDLDVQRPAQASRFGVAPDPGLGDCVGAPCRLTQVMVETDEGLHLVPVSTGTLTEAVRMLEAVTGSALLDECRAAATWTVLDLPPVLETPGVIPVTAASDGCLLVGRYRGTRVDALVRTAGMLSAPVVGFAMIANRSRVPAWITRCLVRASAAPVVPPAPRS